MGAAILADGTAWLRVLSALAVYACDIGHIPAFCTFNWLDVHPCLKAPPILSGNSVDKVIVVTSSHLDRRVLSIQPKANDSVRVVRVCSLTSLPKNIRAKAPSGPIVFLALRVEARFLHAAHVMGSLNEVCLEQTLKHGLIQVFSTPKRA